MNIIIARSLPPHMIESLPQGRPKLCEKFPFLVDANTERIIVPVFRFLISKLRYGYNASMDSGKAWCDDLRDWLYFLDSIEVEWDKVTELHIESFINQSLDMISPKTGEIYSKRTVIRKATTVVSFYKFATDHNMLKYVINFKWKNDNSQTQSSRDKYRRPGGGSGLIPNSPSFGPLPNVVPPDDYLLLSKTLGITPLQWNEQSIESSRDRLISDLGVSTGMRISEILNLTTYQITELPNSGLNDIDFIPLYLTITKNRKPRFVRLPVWLHRYLINYIDQERSHCLKRMSVLRDPGSLFLPRLDARNKSTIGVGYRTVNDQFVRACFRCGLTKKVKVSDYNSGSTSEKSAPLYSHHDLRHTYACNFYLQAKAHGDPEPWKVLASLLGHASIETTINTYLAVVAAIEGSSAQRKLYENLQRNLAG